VKKTYIIVDLECTCTDSNEFPRNQMEIIEIAAASIESDSLKMIEEYNEFVKPVRNPVLTCFCKELTSISQEELENAEDFKKVLSRFKNWIRKHKNPIFCSWGDFDKNQIKQDCIYHKQPYPFGNDHINLKKEFSKVQGIKKRIGIARAIKLCGLKFEGKHHRGIDDVRNIISLLPYIFGENRLQG
jgi:inhibitor of KinA sporulation pathway (predicted exonuclease)